MIIALSLITGIEEREERKKEREELFARARVKTWYY
jgi:hypothetical protein